MRTLSGIVIPAEWDPENRVTAVFIATDDDEEILVDPGPEADALMDLLHQDVSLRGECYLDAKGRPHIRIHQITSS